MFCFGGLVGRQAYAAMEAGDGHPSRAAFILERAESEGCCLHERIWITHSDLLLAALGANVSVRWQGRVGVQR